MYAAPPNPWTCLVCGKEHVDPAMARACESRHERDAALRVHARSGPQPLPRPRAADG
jgi:hypothetical protein